jgi:GNAT superfamily N-acetyltransferase
MATSARDHPSVEIRPLRETDLPAATLVMRRAFGTFLGARDPDRFMADRDHVRSRWQAAPAATLAAVVDDRLVGSNLVTRWGSVGFFGPLTVTPERWDQGVATRLLEPTLAMFEAWGTDHAGLFTFPHSPKHVGLYQKFGFWPRALTAVMSCPVPDTDRGTSPVTLFSELTPADRDRVVEDCRAVTDAIYAGLDVVREIRAVAAQDLGDTVLVRDGDRLVAFGVCHCGAGTEAGASGCYVKFGAARPGPDVAAQFARLLDACIALARARGVTRVDAGVSLAREAAFRAMRSAGFRTQIQGVCMHRPNEPGYHRPGAWVIDDWR